VYPSIAAQASACPGREREEQAMDQTLSEVGFEMRFKEVFRQAAIADEALGKFITRVSQKYPGTIVHAKLKTEDSARGKLVRDEKTGEKAVPDDPATLRDLARATIQYSSLQALYSAREFIKLQPEFIYGGEMKDRYQDSSPVPSGYRDVKFFLGMNIGGDRRHFVELQLNMTSMLDAKEIEHPIYEILRRAGSAQQPRSVTIPVPEAAKLGPRMRNVFVMLKQGGTVNQAHLTALRTVVLKFFVSGDTSRCTLTPVVISAEEIKKIQAITPEVYRTYLDKALHAKIMTGQGLQPMMQDADFRNLTKAKT
jgi:ppGpp synthetase/RelA/SpoT-type nucleotidyltranferase